MPIEKAKKAPKTRKPKISEAKVLELAEKGVSQADIARMEGVDRSTVCRLLQKYGWGNGEVEAFRKDRPDLLSCLQSMNVEVLAKALCALKGKNFDDMSVSELKSLLHTGMISLGIGIDKERLITGQTTANVGNLIMVAREANMERMRRQVCGESA